MSAPPFSVVVAEHGPMVLRFCRSMLPVADAEDVWSETFLAALRAYPDLDREANVAAWLTTIARRKAIDLVRRRDRLPEPSPAIPELPSTPANPTTSANIDPALAVVDRHVGEDLLAALAELSDQQRIAVVCHHVSGYPYREVAEILGTSPAAARRSAADGMAKLRSVYRRERP